MPALSATEPDLTNGHRAASITLLFGGSRRDVDTITETATCHGWNLLFSDEHPHAGGLDHYASYMENSDGFEVELVAEEPSPT